MKYQVERARLFSYTTGGLPRVRVLPSEVCVGGSEFLGGRHFGHTASGLPRVAYGWWCCDAICPDSYDGDCYVQADCWPLGIGPGILRKAVVYLADVKNCLSAQGNRADLTYSDDDGKWHGSVSLRGGGLNLTFECLPGDPGDPGKFSLTISGCDPVPSGTITLTAGYTCADPLVIGFGQATLPHCCDCPISGEPSTDEQPEVSFVLATNCHRVAWARHVGYVPGGSCSGYCRYSWSGTNWGLTADTCGDGCQNCPDRPHDLSPGMTEGDTRDESCITRPLALVARERPCVWDAPPPSGCTMTCGVVATVTNVDGCDCLGGTYDMDYFSGGWQYAGGFPCPGSPGEINMGCTTIDPVVIDGVLVPMVRLCLGIVCSVDCGSSTASCVDIPAADLEDLDVTFTVPITCPASSCSGGCGYTYIEMLPGWSLQSQTCDPPECGPCPEEPVDPPPDPVDGQTLSEPCPNTPPTECCVGTITVRVMR